MDVKWLYTLVAIANHGTFARAGRSVGLSVSAVSLQIQALEEDLGLSLFDRSRRPPILTAHGLNFVERARELLSHWESLKTGSSNSSTAGVLKLGTVNAVVPDALPMALRELRNSHPDLKIQLSTGLSHELEDLLRRGALDAAILIAPEVADHAFSFSRIARSPLLVICHRSIRGKSYGDILKSHPYIRFNRLARVGHRIEKELARQKITIRPEMEVDSIEGVDALVANGLGVSVVPARGKLYPFSKEIRSMPFGSLAVEIGILQAAENPRSNLVSILHQELVTAMRKTTSFSS